MYQRTEVAGAPHLLGLRAIILVLLGGALLWLAPEAGAQEAWLDEDFEGGTEGVFDSGWGISPTSDGHVGAGLISRIPRGDHWGSSAWWYTDDHIGDEPEEMWLRYWLRFPAGFQVREGERGKLPGFGGLYSGNCRGGDPSTSSDPCWSARMMFSHVHNDPERPSFPYDPDGVTRIGFYPYLLDDSGRGKPGQVMPWDVDVATLEHDRWYCVEAHVEMNTPGRSDGVLEGFVNGRQAFSKTDAVFRRSDEGNLAVRSVWFDVYYGGSATSPTSNSISFDSLAAGPSRIGCNDASDVEGQFIDDDDSVFQGDIEQLAASGITKGCNPPQNTWFCPDDPVTRGQMAAFLHRALADRMDVTVPPVPDSPPDLWGMASSTFYTRVMDDMAEAGAPLDALVVRYPIDETSGDKDWLATGSDDNPNKWVPMQLGRIWEGGVTPYIQVTANDLPRLAGGGSDARVDNMLAAFGSYLDNNQGSRLILDILPEANRVETGYGDDPDRFRTAFRSLAEKARSRLGGDRVRIAFSGHMTMSSDRFDHRERPPGAFSLWWPGADAVDLAAIHGAASSAAYDPAGFYGPALDSMIEATGGSVPVVIGLAGAPDDPSGAAQTEFLSRLAGLSSTHPVMVGVMWEDTASGDRDLRITAPSVSAGLDVATAATRTGGLDWLFSEEADRWSRDRRASVPFGDSLDSVFSDSIRWLSASGVTRGCDPPANTLFCPQDAVTRGQMAAFLVRALGLPESSATFSDTVEHVFSGDVSALAGAGITRGCNPPSNTRFCPDEPVTRAQMAAFLVRAGLAG
ncbi:MAG: S-layer homology domain-containing protein [Actinomycetota bacterium]